MSQMKASDLAIVKSLPGNDKCADCSMKHPQWASVSFGNLFCLECSGIHRSLGVHISFVRSIAMDSWSESQLEIMKNGGNDKCNEYLKQNGISPVVYSTSEAVNGGIKKKYDNDVALLYKLKLKARVEGKPEPTEVPKKTNNKQNTYNNTNASFGGPIKSSEAVDPNGMERLPGESDSQYIARQTRLREEAKARMAAKFGNSGGTGKRVMGGIGSSPHPSQQGMGGFDMNSFTSGLASVTSTAASGLGSAWSRARETANSVSTNDKMGSIGSGVSELGSSLWSGLSQASSIVSREINAVVTGDDSSENTFSDLNRHMKEQKGSSTYAGFGSQDLMAKETNQSSTRTVSQSNNVDMNSIAALPNETDKEYMERQLRIQQEAKARMNAKFGDNPNKAMSSMSVGATTTKPTATNIGGSDDFFASFGT